MSRLSLALALVTASAAVASAHGFSRPPQEIVSGFRAPDLDRASVRAALRAARANNVAAFRAYEQRGVYPSNVLKDSALNVWRDQDGHLCAAATIIKASGQEELVARVADQDNFIRLADVTQGPLMDWILTSGLTQAEIVTIQEPFMPVTHRTEPAPVVHVAIDNRLRRVEDTRLHAKYRAIARQLARQEAQSIELAVNRLMTRPALARKLLALAAAS